MKLNLCAADRIIRAVIGVVLVGAGLALVRGVLGIVLAALGALLLLSASMGFCHVYKVLGIDTSKRC